MRNALLATIGVALLAACSPAAEEAAVDQAKAPAAEPAVQAAAAALGTPAHTALTHDRADVDFRRFLVSDPQLAGRTVAELDFASRLEGAITRVKRGDLDMVAADDLVLQPGDRVLAVVPRERMDEAAEFFGDSERRISEIDSLAFALGLAVGLLLGQCPDGRKEITILQLVLINIESMRTSARPEQVFFSKASFTVAHRELSKANESFVITGGKMEITNQCAFVGTRNKISGLDHCD